MPIYAVVRETMRITDPAIEKTVRTPLAYSEGLAHFFGAAILNAAGTGNESLSGYTVTAHFIRGDNYYGNITGAVDGNVAYVILPGWCYRAAGRFTLTVYLNSGSGSSATTRCIMIVQGRVMADTTNSMVDPDHVVPDLAALIAQMQQISAAIAKINGMTVSVSTLSPGSSATATLTTVGDHYNLALGIPQGAKGNPGNVSTVNSVSPDAQGNVTLPTDSTPTDNSTNYVTSGGVKSALDSRNNSISALEAGIAILSDNNTHAAITYGQYVYVRNHGTLAEGLYRAAANIAQNDTLSSSNMVAVSGGGLNALNNMLIPVAVTFTPVSGVSVDLGGSYQIGQMVYVDMRVHLETAIANGTVGKFAKVPKTGYYANNYVPIVASAYSETAASVYGYIMNNGDLCVFRDGSLTPQADYYTIVAMYISD